MTGLTGISFAPLVPWELVAVLAAVGVVLLLFGMVRGARGSLVRLFALAVLSLGLLNPYLESESREAHPTRPREQQKAPRALAPSAGTRPRTWCAR